MATSYGVIIHLKLLCQNFAARNIKICARDNHATTILRKGFELRSALEIIIAES